jgi:SAM-dependent methyltransferase
MSRARAYLFEHLKAEAAEYFGTDDEIYLSHICDAWMDDENNSKHRFDTIQSIIGEGALRTSRILDMSSGCGTFVFYGLIHGYDTYGLEPERWKHLFNIQKANEKGYPAEWAKRFCLSTGEFLPFKEGAFDVISTYQTLEHVRSLMQCFGEFRRVLRTGGLLLVQCPDYRSWFEGHYRIPMLPLMNRTLFRIYLRTIRRPTEGLASINYITKKKIFRLLGDNYEILDLPMIAAKSHLHEKFKIESSLLTHAYLKLSAMRNLYRQENSICLAAIRK